MEGAAHSNLGSAHHALNNNLEAEKCFTQQREIAKHLCDLRGEASALSGLGNLAFTKGHYAEAIALYQNHLTLAQTIGHTQGILHAQRNLDEAYRAMKDETKDDTKAVSKFVSNSCIK